MLGMLALTFLFGCVVGAALIDLARWRQQRSAAQNLLRALDSGTLYYGRQRRDAPLDQESNETT